MFPAAFALITSLFLLALCLPNSAAANESPLVLAAAEQMFMQIVHVLETILFVPIPLPTSIVGENSGVPALVLWLVFGGFYFSIVTKCVNIRLLCHALAVTRGRFTRPSDPGEISHFQAMATSISGTVGLGNIAGVSVAVAVGGPGAVIWMMVAGIFGMSTKFAEALLGHKFRRIEKDGIVKAGAFLYLREGLASKGYKAIGRGLALLFAICCLGGAFGAGNMFQSNQTVAILTDSFAVLEKFDIAIALLLAFMVGVVIIGGISRVATVAEKLVPTMAIIYILACIIVIIANISVAGEAISFMISAAFSGSAAAGGALGAMIVGFQRSAFSNEAGIGSASIVHPTARNTEPVRAGCTALLETFIDTMVICFLTGLVITITGVYADVDKTGIELASASFRTVINWFPIVLSVCVFFFAFSTMITWSYYGGQAWLFLFKGRGLVIYQLLFCSLTFLGGALDGVMLVLKFSDLLLLSMAIPNLIGLYLMSDIIRSELSAYMQKLRRGEVIKVDSHASHIVDNDADVFSNITR
ncbi:MAG: alanine:cation symporter family protein [Sphaerospermopsis sp. SIO1G2]|nr:alanine:cation symporter family protein [Sphaerospermopsis sp. SIO1G2]